MKSSPESVSTWEQVRELLGQKVVDALAGSILPTRRDYQDYREAFPLWVSQHTERGLASWIHDRMWAHLAADLSELPGVFLTEKEPLREVTDGSRYRLRIKRHSTNGGVSSYATPAYLDFLFQTPTQESLDGLSQVNLIAGYEWLADERAIGDALISLRVGRKPRWVVRLTSGEPDSGQGVVIRPIQPTPKPPTIDTPQPEPANVADDEE